MGARKVVQSSRASLYGAAHIEPHDCVTTHHGLATPRYRRCVRQHFHFNQRYLAMKTLARAALIIGTFGIAVALAGCGGGGGNDSPPGTVLPTTVVQALPLPGPNTVACSNVAQDFS